MCAVDIDHVERRSCRDAKTLSLSNGKVVNAVVTPDSFSAGGHDLAGTFRRRLALFRQVRFNELLIVTGGHKTYLLRLGLFRQSQAMPAGSLTHLGFGHLPQREPGAASLA